MKILLFVIPLLFFFGCSVEDEFGCRNSTINYQGQTYGTVLIGEQCWMKENLNYDVGNSWCFDNKSSNCNTYGRLYDWTTIMNGGHSSNSVPSGVQGICPTGWHVPSDAEWTILTDNLGGISKAGGKMKTTGTIQDGTGLWTEPNTGATNESNFSALPASSRNEYYGFIIPLGLNGYFWTSTEQTGSEAWFRWLKYDYSGVYRTYHSKASGCSLRCLKD